MRRTSAATEPATTPGLTELLREDWVAHGRKWHRPGFHAVAVHRLGTHARRLPGPLRRAGLALHGVLYFVTRNLYGIELPLNASVGRRVVVGHGGGVVVGESVVLGDGALIRQNVTVGVLEPKGPSPRIGAGVELGAGAVVVGGVEVGDGAVLGPNVVVTSDVPAGARVVAPPPRVLRGPAPAETRNGDAVGAVEADALVELIRSTLELDGPLGADTPLLSSGLVDSLNFVVLVEAIEEAYGVALPAHELGSDRYDTPAQLAGLVDAAGPR